MQQLPDDRHRSGELSGYGGAWSSRSSLAALALALPSHARISPSRQALGGGLGSLKLAIDSEIVSGRIRSRDNDRFWILEPRGDGGSWIRSLIGVDRVKFSEIRAS
ncbi:hypothetical protein GOP47_0030287 [Adiantum capillus-veneris]|nr:hypothetical protein GOP47_0030287 [Adiantum capillus-veneris]